MNLRSGIAYGTSPGIPTKHSVQFPLTQQNLYQFQYEANINNRNINTKSTSSSEGMPSSLDSNYALILRMNGIYFDSVAEPLEPLDKNKILRFLQRKNETLLQSKDFLIQLNSSFNEETYKFHFIHQIFQPSKKFFKNYSIQMDLVWTKVTGTSLAMEGLSNPKPDYSEAFLLDSYPRKALSIGCIQPSGYAFTMPTLCVEFKAPGIGSRDAIAQAAYDGAIMVNTAWEIHKYMKKPAQDFFGKTKALVIAIADKTFELFACHAMPADWEQSKDQYPPKVHYHIYRLAVLVVDFESNLQEICRLVPNAQDWCRAQADMVKNDLWEHFERLEQEELNTLVEERGRNGAARTTSDMKRKRKMDETEQRYHDIQPTKRRKRQFG